MVASLSVRRIDWKTAFSSMTIKIGQSHNALDYQPRKELLRRQEEPTTTSSAPTTVTTTGNFSLQAQMLERGFGLDLIDLSCKNCTTTGSLSYDATFDIDSIPPRVDGEVSITLQGFSAHMSLSANFSSSQEYEIPLPISQNHTIEVSQSNTRSTHQCISFVCLSSLTLSID